MRTRAWGVTLAIASVVAIGPPAAAQGDDPHPAWIQSGACADGGAIMATLADVSGAYLVDGDPSAGSAPVGLGSAVPLSASVTTLPVALPDLVVPAHSLAVARSATDRAIVACGDIGGLTLGGMDLPFGLAAVDGSGSVGVASLRDEGAGTTTVTVYLMSGERRPVATPGLAPTAVSVTLGSALQWAGWDITVEDATYDRDLATLTVNATFHNTATAPMDLNSLSSGGVWVSWDQNVLSMSPANAPVPAGTTVRGAIVGQSIPAGFVMDDAVLTFGLPGDHQATLALAEGAPATFEQPVTLDLTKTIRAKKFATFKVTGATVVAARCSGNSDGYVLTAAPANEATIVMTVTVSGGPRIGVGGMSLGGSFVTDPSGVGGADTLLKPVLDVREVLRDTHYCFPVATPVQGRYLVTFLTDPVKASLGVDVP